MASSSNPGVDVAPDVENRARALALWQAVMRQQESPKAHVLAEVDSYHVAGKTSRAVIGQITAMDCRQREVVLRDAKALQGDQVTSTDIVVKMDSVNLLETRLSGDALLEMVSNLHPLKK
mmetsp:Transcript_15847/g.28219  ORF Transcript_15847/g.28219 Transcript_15847/m.28219 type:complete len:120 (+) Transcript_15847:148-507(+)